MTEKLQNIKDWALAFLVIAFIVGLAVFYIYRKIVMHQWILASIFSLGLLIFVLSLIMLPFMLERGLRKQFPMDYLLHLPLEIKYFEEKGFSIKEYLYPGTEHPGIALESDGIIVEVRLNVPLNSMKYRIRISSLDGLCLEYDKTLDSSQKVLKLDKFYNQLENLRNL